MSLQDGKFNIIDPDSVLGKLLSGANSKPAATETATATEAPYSPITDPNQRTNAQSSALANLTEASEGKSVLASQLGGGPFWQYSNASQLPVMIQMRDYYRQEAERLAESNPNEATRYKNAAAALDDPIAQGRIVAGSGSPYAPDAATTAWQTAFDAANQKANIYGAGALAELAAPEKADVAGYVKRAMLNSEAIRDMPDIDFDQLARDQMGNLSRQINYETDKNARRAGAALASRGLAGSGAAARAMADVIAEGNRSLSAAGTDIANQLADRRLTQRGQNVDLGTTMMDQYGTLAALGIQGDLANAQLGTDVNAQRANILANLASGSQAQALNAGNAAVGNLYMPAEQSLGASNAIYNLYNQDMLSKTPGGSELSALLSSGSPYYGSNLNTLGSAYDTTSFWNMRNQNYMNQYTTDANAATARRGQNMQLAGQAIPDVSFTQYV